MSSEQGLCPFCGTEQLVKKDGTLAKHLAADGGVCEGWNKQPVPPEAPAEDETQAPADDDGWDDETAEEPVDPVDLDDDPSPPADPSVQDIGYGKGAYSWRLTVKPPVLYLNDSRWHAANARMAGAMAEEAGHTVLAEAQCTSVETGDDGTVILTYQVPVGG